MVVVNVQNHADCAGQVQEGLVVLAGFDNDALAVAGLAVTIDKGQLAADNGSRQNASAPSFLLWVALAASQAVRAMSA